MSDESQFSLIGKTPRMKEINYETREPLLKAHPTIYEYIINNLQIIIIVSLIIIASLFIWNEQIFDNIFSRARPETPIDTGTTAA